MAMAKLEDEAARQSALERYNILDSGPETEFDLITGLMRSIFAVPMAAMTLVDSDRQWLKSRQGIDVEETPRSHSFCDQTIRQHEVLRVVDARQDPRFRENPFVTGEPYIRSYMGAPLTTPDGYNIGTICVMDTIPREYGPVDCEVLANLARLVMSQMELRLIADEDPQTGACTRRAFFGVLRQALERARHGDPEGSVLVFDLDHFRTLNESCGHAFGDVVLNTVARSVSRMIRRGDRFGRLGGEEFGIFLRGIGLDAALQTAERLRAAIEDTRFPGHPDVRVTASFGIMPCSSDFNSGEAWALEAERLMQTAKAAGRNRCVGPTVRTRRKQTPPLNSGSLH